MRSIRSPGARSRWCGGRPRRLVLSAALIAFLLVACLPVPDVQVPLALAAPTYRVPLHAVAVETTWWPAPSAPSTPPEFDRSGVRRTFLPGETAAVIMVAMPGLLGGAGSFDHLARQLVATQPGLEVWAIDRRSNQFEDRTGLAEAIAAGDPEIALRYYLGTRSARRTFSPRTPDDLRFMAHWGLFVHLRDLHEVVVRARATGAAVVLAGHSLGAGLVSVYAAYRVPPEDGGGVGQDYIEALVLLDGTIGRTSAFGRADSGVDVLGFSVVPSIADLTEGRGSPFLTIGTGPQHFVHQAVVAAYARLDPEGTVPRALSSFPASGRAALGIIADDAYGWAPVFGISVGEARGAEFSGNLTAFLLMGAQGARSRTVIGVAPDAERVEWDDGDPLREVSDLDALALAATDPDADLREWYFPIRLLLDLAALDPRHDDVRGFVSAADVTIPTLAIGAGRGLVQSAAGFQSYANTRVGAPITATALPGFTHSDVLFARDNPVVAIVGRWLTTQLR
jgi:hypothetical protein